MGRKTSIYRRLFARVLAVIFLVLQGIVLDYCLIVRKSSSWWFTWILTDAIVLSAWVYTMWMSHRKSQSEEAMSKDGLKFAYIAWVVYAIHLVPQVATVFKHNVNVFEEEELVFGTNIIKMNLCLTPMLFLFLIYAHHDAKSHSRRKYYLEKITAAVTLDLFDSVEMLEYLFEKEKISIELENAILSFSCMNIFLPIFALLELKFNKFHDNGVVSPISFKFIYICSFMFFVNVPFLVLRLILWHGYHLDVSVLLAKNVLAIMIGIIEIFEFFSEQRPRKCDACSWTFAKDHFKAHRKTCSRDQKLETIACVESISGNEKLDIITLKHDQVNDFIYNVPDRDIFWPTFSKKTYV